MEDNSITNSFITLYWYPTGVSIEVIRMCTQKSNSIFTNDQIKSNQFEKMLNKMCLDKN